MQDEANARDKSLSHEPDNRSGNDGDIWLQRLLDDLRTLAREYPDYKGMVDTNGDGETYRLRYHAYDETRCDLPDGMAEMRDAMECRRTMQHEAVRKLESIANRIARHLTRCGEELPKGETLGASIVAWATADELKTSPVMLGFGTSPYSDPFTSIRDKLQTSLEEHDSQPEQPKSKRRKKVRTESQVDWERVVRDYENYTKPGGYRRTAKGPWTAMFEAFWNDRIDLQSWSLEVAFKKYDAARKQIDRRR